MTKQEIIEFLKESLSVRVEYDQGNSWSYPSIKVELLLDDEVISEYDATVLPER